ncbi:MAG: ABC transporter permease [candidate division Zixibacteria bacterium]|nr:ABC transporter permease [candidate division Zixibacteria bacterium]
MMIPPSYTLRNITNRKITSSLTIFGIALVVFVFAASQMLTNGMKETLVATGGDDNVIMIRKASQAEMMSIINYEQGQIVSTFPEIAKASDGSPLMTNETVVLITVPTRSSGEAGNITVRGVTDKSFEIRSHVKITQGRMWTDPGSEIIAGIKIAEKFEGCGVGETVRFGARDWTIVGVFESEGSGFESEVWGERQQMSDAFRRPIYSSLTMKISDTIQFASLRAKVEGDPRLPLDVKKEKQYYEDQSQIFSSFMGITGYIISIIFSFGAIVGAMITMYAAVANRTKEIGTLRSLGFGRSAILTSFLLEAILISFFGGILGVVGAYLLQMVEVSTTNWSTFTDIAFKFKLNSQIAVSALVFSIVMGVVGGFLPAVRAARLKIVEALRSN